MAETSAAVRADDISVRWWEPVVAFAGGNAIAVAIATATLLGAIVRGMPLSDATALLTTNFMGIMGSIVLSDATILALGWWLVRRRTASPLAAYFPAVPMRAVLTAAAVGVVLSLAVNGLNQLIDSAGWVHFTDTATEQAMVPHTLVQFAVSIFAVTLLAPVVEEFVFRGLLMRWLLPFSRAVGAVAVSGCVFGVIHGQFFQHPGAQGLLLTVELAVIGAVLGLWVVRTRSLRTSFAMHAAFNLTATILSVIWP
ncbi:MAG: CPBP family intramembrane metalloprotease [Alphaproteobacteria bacterium]|nr:CPBP family intramembrane metalloprotease [Alphaproteobacteria bacterium]MBL7100006.1 CPBP family intramembrane metalloprotease [Alphaproteobacteria bacterium]